MSKLTITHVERTWVSVPLKPRHARHLTRENWDWTVFEILQLYTNSEWVGVGETMCYYTWSKVTQEQVDRVIGRSPFELLWDDSLGAGLQMAVYDLAGKALGVPAHRLLGTPVRDACPVSWWANDMSTEDWLDEMDEALSLGYLSAKLKARPWRDYMAQVEALSHMVPSDFRFDADFNGFLRDVGTAVPYAQALERYAAVNILESPLPQGDVEGNALLRQRISRPIAMHYGTPPIDVALRERVCDGFVIGGGANALRNQGTLAAQFNKPFFLQLVGTGLTTAWMLHWGAVLTHATWPAVTCHEIYEDDLLCERLPVNHGYMSAPTGPGLGVALDEEVVARYRVEPGYAPPPPSNLYRVSWPSGASMTYPPGKRDVAWNRVGTCGLWDDFAAGNQPLFHHGVRLDILPDDGSGAWAELFARAKRAPVRG
jgi:L-alanine-DL-glutamate epimerase-like enolase superfamily enzyme